LICAKERKDYNDTGAHPRIKIFTISSPLWGEDTGEGKNLYPPSPAAFPASGSRNPYLYIEERERHLPLAGPRIPCSVLWSGAVFSDLCKAERDLPSPAGGRGESLRVHRLGMTKFTNTSMIVAM